MIGPASHITNNLLCNELLSLDVLSLLVTNF